MENNNPADHGGRRRGAELADRIAAFIQHLDSLETLLIQAIKYADRPAYSARATIMRIYMVLKIIQLLVFLKMGRQNIDPRFRLTTALIVAALGCVRCGLLIYILLGDMPWLIFVLCILMPFTFMAN